MGITQGTQTGALLQAEGRWEGGLGGRGTWVYLWPIFKKTQNLKKKKTHKIL